MSKLTYFSTAGFLLKYIAPHKKTFAMFYLGRFFDMVLGIALPILLGIMIDSVVHRQDIQTFLSVSAVFAVMSLFLSGLYFLVYTQYQHLMGTYVVDIQRTVFNRMQGLSAAYMSGAKTGDIVNTVQHWSRECMYFVTRNMVHSFNSILNITILTVYIFIIDTWLGLFSLVTVPISTYVKHSCSFNLRGIDQTEP